MIRTVTSLVVLLAVVIEQTETRCREATAAVLRDVPSGGELAERATARPRDCASHRARLSKSERDR
ncbi:MAG: hypothetical protein AB1725_12450, partial [Armatimonadota bacterium]